MQPQQQHTMEVPVGMRLERRLPLLPPQQPPLTRMLTPLETPQVVGSVVGSLAGAALILAIILLLLRRHKRKQGGALQLTGDDHTDNNQSMRQAPTTSSTLVPVAFLNRFSAMSGKTAETNLSGGERSFQRVSGRKLPSEFSEGMTSDQFSQGGTMSGSSFYQDEHGIYGGPSISKEFGKEIGDNSTSRESGQMNIRPSPARTPVIRHPDDGNPFADRHNLPIQMSHLEALLVEVCPRQMDPGHLGLRRTFE